MLYRLAKAYLWILDKTGAILTAILIVGISIVYVAFGVMAFYEGIGEFLIYLAITGCVAAWFGWMWATEYVRECEDRELRDRLEDMKGG